VDWFAGEGLKVIAAFRGKSFKFGCEGVWRIWFRMPFRHLPFADGDLSKCKIVRDEDKVDYLTTLIDSSVDVHGMGSA
jgi:hypothetical protein